MRGRQLIKGPVFEARRIPSNSRLLPSIQDWLRDVLPQLLPFCVQGWLRHAFPAWFLPTRLIVKELDPATREARPIRYGGKDLCHTTASSGPHHPDALWNGCNPTYSLDVRPHSIPRGLANFCGGPTGRSQRVSHQKKWEKTMWRAGNWPRRKPRRRRTTEKKLSTRSDNGNHQPVDYFLGLCLAV
jgi:hypothetical protein